MNTKAFFTAWLDNDKYQKLLYLFTPRRYNLGALIKRQCGFLFYRPVDCKCYSCSVFTVLRIYANQNTLQQKACVDLIKVEGKDEKKASKMLDTHDRKR